MLIGLILVVVKTSVRAVHRDELGDAAKDRTMTLDELSGKKSSTAAGGEYVSDQTDSATSISPNLRALPLRSNAIKENFG
jgi:hypothetical protein